MGLTFKVGGSKVRLAMSKFQCSLRPRSYGWSGGYVPSLYLSMRLDLADLIPSHIHNEIYS
jgi:hypothetical protein